MHLSWIETECLLGQSAVSPASRSGSFAIGSPLFALAHQLPNASTTYVESIGSTHFRLGSWYISLAVSNSQRIRRRMHQHHESEQVFIQRPRIAELRQAIIAGLPCKPSVEKVARKELRILTLSSLLVNYLNGGIDLFRCESGSSSLYQGFGTLRLLSLAVATSWTWLGVSSEGRT